MNDAEAVEAGAALVREVELFFKNGRETLPAQIYDDAHIDAWAASRGFHVDRPRDADGDYSCITVLAWREGYTCRAVVPNVISVIKQEAAFKARKKKEAA